MLDVQVVLHTGKSSVSCHTTSCSDLSRKFGRGSHLLCCSHYVGLSCRREQLGAPVRKPIRQII